MRSFDSLSSLRVICQNYILFDYQNPCLMMFQLSTQSPQLWKSAADLAHSIYWPYPLQLNWHSGQSRFILCQKKSYFIFKRKWMSSDTFNESIFWSYKQKVLTQYTITQYCVTVHCNVSPQAEVICKWDVFLYWEYIVYIHRNLISSFQQ